MTKQVLVPSLDWESAIMSWLERVAANILHLSRNSEDVNLALKEWFYTGDTIDLDEPSELCQLCDHPDIRYQFVIRNKFTRSELLIGSECITRFGISAVDESGEWLNERETERKVRKDRGNLITNAKKRAVINSLVALAALDEDFDINDFIGYLQDRGAFTPSQLGLLMWRLEKFGIPHRKSYFKLTIRRKRELLQLLRMESWKAAKLWLCMTPSQRQKYVDENGVPEEVAE